MAKKWLFWFCEGSALCVGAKPNVPLVRLAKIVFKKCGREKNKKLCVGNEFRLTRCPIEIWSVCWSPVKMVCPCVNVQFLVVCSMVALLSFRLAYNRFGYCRRRGFLAQKFNRRTNVEPCTNVQSKPFSPAFGNTLLAVRLSFLSQFVVIISSLKSRLLIRFQVSNLFQFA